MKTLCFLGLFFLSTIEASFAALPTEIKGKSVLDFSDVHVSANKKSGLVLVFLSSTCPCSNSHISELSSLHKDFPDFSFVAIHSNANEEKKATQDYFKKAAMPFAVISDSQQKIANTFQALKTPHAFIVTKEGTLAYAGGVSNSSDFSKADRKYLREALEDLKAGKPVRTPEGRTLGCIISRGGKNVW